MSGQLFTAFLTWNAVLAAGVVTLLLLQPVCGRLRAELQLSLHYAVFAFTILASAGALMVTGGELFEPVMKVWSQAETPRAEVSGVNPGGVIHLPQRQIPVPADYFFLFSVGLGLGAGLMGLVHVMKGQRQLRRILRAAFVIRRIGRVSVLASEDVHIPFSYRSLTRAYIVLPNYLLTSPENFRMTVAHELQHHRQGDTKWTYVFALTRAICFFNPLVHFWNRWIGELQEFACDEALVGRQGFRAREYARCLIEVAETAWVHEEVPACATGMTLLSRGNLLNRRIQFMFQQQRAPRKIVGLVIFAATAAMLTTTAFAAKGLVQDRRISMAQAQEMARAAQKDSSFPVEVNEEVLRYLNHYIGTVDGREKMRAGLRRMEAYRPLVTAKINEYQAPIELMAVPLIESGYQNLESRHNPVSAAGLWQFIASTARRYGLRVNEHVDQRLNEDMLTDAAMRYLLSNKLRFKDWQLSVLSFNAGENAVQEAIFQTGSRNAWDLVRNSNLSRESKNYLPKVMAAILIMRNPSSVD